MEPPTKLIAARKARNLSQQALANAIGCSRETINAWESGRVTPQDHWVREVCKFFGDVDPEDLDLPPITYSQSRGEYIAMLQKELEKLNLDRRELLEFLGSLSVFAGVNLPALLESPNAIAPEDFLDQCNAGISACWHLMKHDGLSYAENILAACVPKLSDLATQSSDIQEMAASLATEAKVQQTILASHRLDYRKREIYASGAVRFGKLSDDGRILAVAISWQADMYTSSWNRHPQPQKAIKLFREGLAGLDDEALLNRADLSIGLAKAYALDRNEAKTIEAIKQAREAMPAHPEQDPLYRMSEFGLAELDQQEGRIYLELDRLFPNQGYAQAADDALSQGMGIEHLTDRARSQRLILKSDAALALDNVNTFFTCIEQGLTLALQIGSLKRKKEAWKVLGKVPESWKSEKRYQNLVKMF